MRAAAYDGSTVHATSEMAAVLVDNTAPSVSLNPLPDPLRGVHSFTADATDQHAGIDRVVFQHAPAGSSTFTDMCTVTSTSYSCDFDTSGLGDGSHDFRAVALDRAGNSETSRTVRSAVDDDADSPLAALDVQATNGAGTARRLDDGDRLTFTYSEQVDLASVTAGWTGTAQAVTVRLRDGRLLGRADTEDTLAVERSGTAVNLGAVDLNEDFARRNRAVVFDATMTAGTTTAGGVTRTTVTVTLGGLAPGSRDRDLHDASAATMVWSPSTSVNTRVGGSCSATPASETGWPPDGDF